MVHSPKVLIKAFIYISTKQPTTSTLLTQTNKKFSCANDRLLLKTLKLYEYCTDINEVNAVFIAT